MIASAGVWALDAESSRLEFAIKHLMFSTLRGRFGAFEGTLEVGADGTASAVGSVQAASIDTNDPVRDGHLRSSADFFDVESYPRIDFRSTGIEGGSGGSVRIRGELTMRGITRVVVLDGQREDVESGTGSRIRLTLRGELNRREFGLVWNQALDSGGALIGNTVKITAEISAVNTGATSGAGRLSPGKTLDATPLRRNARSHGRAAARG